MIGGKKIPQRSSQAKLSPINSDATSETRVLRVFPSHTEATPGDGLSVVGDPGLFLPKFDEIHISVTFSWDLEEAERLKRAWSNFGPVKIGGPAFGKPSGDFIPGKYMKKGNLITSRGCNNRCWFCEAWKREGNVRELPIEEGWIIHDDNFLACSEKHILNVFKMLEGQPLRPQFRTLEAKLLESWHVELLKKTKTERVYFSYDDKPDFEDLVKAHKLLKDKGFLNRRKISCYVLCGFKGDTFEAAEKRMLQVVNLGMTPFAMLYQDKEGMRNKAWLKFQRKWVRPWIIFADKKSRVA